MRQAPRVHEVRETDGYRSQAHEAMQDGHQLRHLGHLHPAGGDDTDGSTDQQGDEQLDVSLGHDTPDRRRQRDGHTDDAVPVAAPRGFLVRQTPERQDEEDGRDDVRTYQDSIEFHDDLPTS